ncbi:hypothetical protein DM01DRAFT_1334107 [Hesseltinella vesiculosa]|uniref:Uncharacterized protein n=1 Tax=Hesseltinella vesiculosa TaxID=101127 RepID=A0A1X2GMX3_9FUNG|nr:hypothetical protein DM01DRAFT_1334107 [Hesseltinella vesiculosa]
MDIALAVMEDGTELSIRRIDGVFHCICSGDKTFITVRGFQKHVENGCTVLAKLEFIHIEGIGLGLDCESDDDSAQSSSLVIQKTSPPSLLATFAEEGSSALVISKREYDHAILHACKAIGWNQEQQTVLLNIMDAYRLHPLSMNETDTSDELNALTHREHLRKIPNRAMTVMPTSPKKRRLEEPNVTFSVNASLYGSVASGPYGRTLLQHEYVELNDELASFLNHDWNINPAMRFACGRLLSGMILLQTTNGSALLVNTVEDMDGAKLVIGTESFNALITSSIRVDADLPPNLGPTTATFLIDSPAQSLGTRMFVMRKSIESALSLSKNTNVTSTSSSDLLYQLRQMRTRFHHPSTYLCCRSSGPWTDDIAGQPYTIFTLANWEEGSSESPYRIASTLFQSIALCVMLNKELDKQSVFNMIAKINKDTNVRKTLKAVLELFGNDKETIPILGNKHLNKHLSTLANEIASSLSRANVSVAARIKGVLLS